MGKIKCDVHCCEYNDCDCDMCNLKEIQVCNCKCHDAEDKKDTMCDSFKEKESNE